MTQTVFWACDKSEKKTVHSPKHWSKKQNEKKKLKQEYSSL